jgi:hypothetical protein
MKTVYCLLLLCCNVSFLPAESEPLLSDEDQITLLINATKASLSSLQELQTRLASFKVQETRCIENPDDADALFTLSERAFALLASMRENKVEPYFRKTFIEELEKLKKTAESKNLPPILTP